MKKINIIHLIDTLEVLGGTEGHVLQLIKRLNADKYSHLVCPIAPRSSPTIDIYRQNGIEILPLGLDRVYDHNAFKKALYLKKLIRQRSCQIIVCYHFGAELFGLLLSRLAHVPVLLFSRRDIGYKENNWYHQLAKRIASSFATKVIMVAQHQQRIFQQQEHISQNRSVLLYNGVDLNLFRKKVNQAEKRSNLGLPLNAPIIGTVGHIRPIKGHDDFIRAARLVKDEVQTAKFIIVGGEVQESAKEQNYKLFLNELLTELDLHEDVSFLGNRSDVNEILKVMDVFVLPSRSEGFSNALIEAMAAGVPIVATNVGGNSEAIVDGDCGWLVPSATPRKLAEKIIELLKNPQKAAQLGKAAQKRAQSLFSLDGMIEKYDQLFQSTVKSAGIL